VIGYTKILDGQPARPWLVLAHGLSQSRDYFARAVDHLATRYRVLALDLRGHGTSRSLPGPFGVEEYTDDVAEVLSAEGIDQFAYWGTHTGSAVGVALALRSPVRVRCLVLEGAVVPGRDLPRTGELLARARRIARAEGVGRAIEDWLQQADWFAFMRQHPEQTLAAQHDALVQAFAGGPWLSEDPPRTPGGAESQLSRLSLPILTYNGQADLPEFLETARFIQAHAPQVSREIVADAGGFPLWENPRAVLSLVTSFLDRIDRAAWEGSH
jgi:3-oxoadipate enol-lactonase